MPAISVLIKPASGNCNLSCRYCFYCDETGMRAQPSYGMMSYETLESVTKAALEYASSRVTFCFQGGEPMLRGLDFFREAVALQKRHNIRGVAIDNAIQTNGTLIIGEWAEFLAENRFLTGVSLDGHEGLHNLHRRAKGGEDTHKAVMAGIRLLKNHGAEFNILAVVTAQTARKTAEMYRFFRRSGFRYLQFIPCLDPLGEAPESPGYALSSPLYLRFLRTLFDLWMEDMRRGEFVYIRYFDNLLALLLGQPPENCGSRGVCSPQFAIEADGSVFPCDFYMLDAYKLGNANSDSFTEIERVRKASGFIDTSVRLPDECLRCHLLRYCRSGCRRERVNATDAHAGIHRYCEAYKEFLPYALPQLAQLLNSRRA